MLFEYQLSSVSKFLNTMPKPMYGLNEQQKYVQARGRICGILFYLESEYINNYNELKHKLIDEFRCSWNNADIHQQLKDRKKKKTESFHEYMLNMKKVASMGEVEETAVTKQTQKNRKRKNTVSIAARQNIKGRNAHQQQNASAATRKGIVHAVVHQTLIEFELFKKVIDLKQLF